MENIKTTYGVKALAIISVFITIILILLTTIFFEYRLGYVKIGLVLLGIILPITANIFAFLLWVKMSKFFLYAYLATYLCIGLGWLYFGNKYFMTGGLANNWATQMVLVFLFFIASLIVLLANWQKYKD